MGASFLGSGVDARLDALSPSTARAPIRADATAGVAARAVETTLSGQRAVVLATDLSQASGAIGRAEAELLTAGLTHARLHRLPVVLLIDSAGARLTEGATVLGAFRQLQRTVMEAREEDLPMLAVIGRNCFGGASLLAFGAHTRIYPRGSRLGLSGPRALSTMRPSFDAEHDGAELFRCESRARHDEDAILVTDDNGAIAATIAAWLHDPGRRSADPVRTRRMLTRRLRMYRGDPATLSTSHPPPEVEARLDHLFAEGWSAVYCDGLVWGDGWVDGRDTAFAGFVGGRTVNAFGCWQFLEVMREFARDPADLPVTLLLDSPGQAPTPEDEQVLLSEFVAAVAEAAHGMRAGGRSVELWLVGEAGGAVYVALAAAAGTITAWPGAKLATLPARIVDGVIGRKTQDKPSLSALIEARVFDRWTRSPGFGEWPAPHSPS